MALTEAIGNYYFPIHGVTYSSSWENFHLSAQLSDINTMELSQRIIESEYDWVINDYIEDNRQHILKDRIIGWPKSTKACTTRDLASTRTYGVYKTKQKKG